MISTGGTDKVLTEAGIKVTPIEKITGNPKESFDGRIKTISFQIESGILYDRKNPKHVKEAEKLNIPQIDVVVCNLYPPENIDVGGPTMIRAAAKNYENVLVLVDPKDYEKINGKVTDKIRKELAAKAFYHLSLYDSQIGSFLNDESFPEELTVPLKKLKDLRYGENPHQRGALYQMPNTSSPLSKLKHLWGRELSGTNSGDIYTGIETVRQFKEPAAAVIKHLSPCGIALGKDVKEALQRAIESDPVSAFGGVVVLNTKMDEEAAHAIGHMDIVACPEISGKALEILKRIRKSMGIYTFGKIPQTRSEKWDMRWFGGAMLLQDFDDQTEAGFKNWEVVTRKKPTSKQLEQMQFGFKAVKAVRSNAVLVVDENIPMTRGIGSGQTSRIGATKIALEQAGQFAKGGILVSDSFFPFDDSVKLAAKYGISAIVEQGGSINDSQSIKVANETGITMIFSRRRAFRH
ncbi:bifunctional phosphoribosylaminoimidazolecarboxamide formyltransferase/IMP cyclohydrolase [Candidatus Daviesbacteria bacterium]|nr:bifunctional phosphoribosylaminoimidazolecarboxamide formyltransferase/IMP cyclohydrolase [Candidatus Daviesbacteria bacterium]